MSKEKIRLDKFLVLHSYAENLKFSQSLILSGSVLVNEQKITKIGTLISKQSKIHILNKISRFASRGAYKLKHTLEHFKISVKNKLCVDIGASTGGFTEILHINKAKKVFAIDVGYGQLLYRLSNKKNIIVKDKFNAKNLTWKILDEPYQNLFFSIDVIFISVLEIFDTIYKMKEKTLNYNFEIVALIKPQFECEKNQCPNGIVKSGRVHFQVLKKILKVIQSKYKGNIKGLTTSPILGKNGNKEFFVYWIL